MELQPITPDSLDDEALTDLIEIRKSGVAHHASEGNKVQHAIQSLTLIALVELQQRRDADSSDPIYQWRERYEEGSLWDDCTKAQYDGFAKKTDCEVRILYTAPPAPVVTDELLSMAASAIEDLLEHTDPNTSNYSGVWADVPGKLRAATSQAGNSPVTPDGWIPVSERMPEGSEEVLCTKEFDGPCDWRKKVGYWLAGKWVVYGASWTPTHWMPLPAAPQQEDN
ncbi:DUF551 domain-containing protein [uncultured Citrobacter sp.]|uniref:DUF551 domain-containing protein n=1 Tax=uncultured Citrobacter sp. TaxID=200446 RepID=UPI00266B76EA|nr:DUF551 domain-containing protein [uncultured Citrobacter sp.]